MKETQMIRNLMGQIEKVIKTDISENHKRFLQNRLDTYYQRKYNEAYDKEIKNQW